ncbi:MAG: hypothetical protein IJ367_04075, partial [Clostridia bacterium]|nr:hypothetical protein [Clostridia bacterium]
ENRKPLTKHAETDVLKQRIFLIGDSICASYKYADYPQEGWGACLEDQFSGSVQVENRAIGGRSTKSYISEGNLGSLAEELIPGDYVFINLGINDDAADARYTTEEEYEENLYTFCETIKAKGAVPVLITPHQVARSEWLSKQDVRVSVMKKVAEAQNITILDLNTEIRNRWMGGADGVTQEEIDEAFSKYYLSKAAFTFIEETYGRSISTSKWEYIENENDHIHINFIGAESLADMIGELLFTSDCPLKIYLAK